MPNVVPYTLTFEIVTIFPPRDFLFLSPIQVIGFLCSLLQREIRPHGTLRPAGLPDLVSKSLEPYGNRKFGMETKWENH